MEDTNTSINNFDPIAIERYFEDIKFPITYDELMLLVRSRDIPGEVVEQMEEMLRSDTFHSQEQIANELGGFYDDGTVTIMDEQDES